MFSGKSGNIFKFQIPQIKALVLPVAVMLMVSLINPPAVRGDDESAKIYLKKAVEQAQQKNYYAALETFEKAINESPVMPEIYFEQGVMYYQNNEISEAIKYFNKTTQLIDNLPAPTPAQKTLQQKIKTYQAEYGKMSGEFTGIKQKYTAKFLALAEKYQDSGDEYLINILNWLSRQTAKAESRESFLQIRQAVFAQIKATMTPLFDGTMVDWETKSTLWSVENEHLVSEIRDREPAVIKHKIQLENNYIVAATLKATESQEPYVMGLLIGGRIDHYYSFGIFQGNLVFTEFLPEHKEDRTLIVPRDVAEKPLPPNFDITRDNDFLVKVNEDNVTCYLNNELQFDLKIPDGRKNLSGSVGLLSQNCKVNTNDIAYLLSE